VQFSEEARTVPQWRTNRDTVGEYEKLALSLPTEEMMRRLENENLGLFVSIDFFHSPARI
jgi:hypothetical protein